MEPILVKNPNTGKYVNVAPLFEAMGRIDNPLSESIETALRVINLAEHNEGMHTKKLSANFDLYQLKDMFSAMVNFSDK